MELALFSGTSKLKERVGLYYKLTRSFVIQQSKCLLCAHRCNQMPLLCRCCYQDLVRFKYHHVAHNLLNWPAIANNIKHKHIDRLVCAAPYQWPVDQWITGLKYHNQYHYACLLGNIITPFLKRHLLNIEYRDALVIAVPISTSKWTKRHYNQCHLIARQLQKRIPSLNYRTDILIHAGNKNSQVGKSGTARRAMQSTFEVTNRAEVKNRRVILLDDVLTTGTTANSIAGLLKKNGADKVAVVTIALSLPD